MENICSIFNDVLGPVMTGPSSSHTAGCARIGKMTRELWGEEIQKARIVFEKNGSYPSCYMGQGSNYGFIGGLLGYYPEDERLKDAIEIAIRSDKDIQFCSEDLGNIHPNQARIDIYENGNLAMSLMTFSVGGGMFQIRQMDGFDVMIEGNRNQYFVACVQHTCEEQLKEILKDIPYDVQYGNGKVLFTFEGSPKAENAFHSLQAFQNPGKLFTRYAPVLMPVEMRRDPIISFVNAKAALAKSRLTGQSTWELALDYECAVGEIDSVKAIEKMNQILAVMRKSSCPIPPNRYLKTGFLQSTSTKIAENIHSANLADIGYLNKAMLAAVSVMENNCSHNVVVAAPTAGSSGVIPGAVVTLGDAMGLPEQEIVKGLFASGLVGAFIANQATFAAEVAGCQAENGSSSCMAAAGIVQLLGGTVEQAFCAANIALQNLLGLICDPVGGLTEIPCINRNVGAIANAAISANLAMCGFDPVVSLDEVIRTMYKVGRQLPRELRCTCEGGLCRTKTGEEIEKMLAEKRSELQR